MFELTETNPPLAVLDAEYQRLLGYPKNHVPSGRSRELADAARKWFSENGRPWIYAREIGALELRDEKLRIGGSEFSSRKLHDLFAGAPAERAVLVAVSAGKECEEKARQLWQESKPDEYFFMEIFGSAVVEHLVTVANGRICGWADANAMAALPHYSPGYSGWDIADQVKLWNFIKQTSGRGFPGELDVHGNRDAPAKEIPARPGRHHAQSGAGAPFRQVDPVRKLFVAALPVPPGAPP